MKERSFRNNAGSTKKKLAFAISLSLAFVVVEAVIGILTGSLSLISDAGHNLTDTLAMGLSLFAVFMMMKDPTPRRTYGYGRIGILTALTNAIVLVGVAGLIIYSSVMRIINISPVNGPAISITAAAAFIVNSLVAMTLYTHREDLNIRSAVLHMASDALLSLGVVIGGIIITFTGWYYADPLIALGLSVFIVWSSILLTKETLDILLESVPKEINVHEVQEAMLSIDSVEGVHHLHIWELGSKIFALSGHVEVEDCKVSESTRIVSAISELLERDFNIIHPTIQIECISACSEDENSECAGSPEGEKKG